MNLDVRNVDPFVMKILDELAKEKGISRSELVRSLLSKFVVTRSLEGAENDYRSVLENTINEMNKLYSKVELLDNKLTDITFIVENKIYEDGEAKWS